MDKPEPVVPINEALGVERAFLGCDVFGSPITCFPNIIKANAWN